MTDLLGNEHWLGAKLQAVAGTPETAVTVFLPTTKIKMDGNRDRIERKAKLATRYQLPGLPGNWHPTASCDCELHASQARPFYWALGAVVTTAPGTTAKLHTITEADAPPRLTLEANKVFQKDRQADAYLGKLELGFKPGEIATLGLEFMAVSHDDDVTVTSTPTYTADPLVCSKASVSIGGVKDYTVEGGSIAYNGNLEEKRGLTDLTQFLASTLRRKDNAEITAKLDFLDFPKAYLADMQAAENFALVVELTGALIESTYYKFVRVTLPACQFTGGLDEEISEGLITGSAEITAYYDTVTGRRILIEVQNTIASLTA